MIQGILKRDTTEEVDVILLRWGLLKDQNKKVIQMNAKVLHEVNEHFAGKSTDLNKGKG